MGSPVSAVVANLYMEYFEDLALSQAPDDCVPRIWKRYVDDTFCILKKDAVQEHLSHLNSLRPIIRFSIEVERDGSLPFLDTLLQRKEDGSLGVTVYRKHTHTDHYLPPSPCQERSGQMPIQQAKNNTNSQDNLTQEDHPITTVLKQDGYPDAFIHSSTRPQPTQDADDQEVE